MDIFSVRLTAQTVGTFGAVKSLKMDNFSVRLTAQKVGTFGAVNGVIFQLV